MAAGADAARVVVANRRDGGWWWRLPVVAALWLALAAPLLAGGAVVVALRRWARDLPAVPDLAAWRHAAPRTSYLLAADGARLAELPFRDGVEVGHRLLVPFARLPPVLLRAVLAAEDVHFLAHHGVDYPAILRAAWINFQAGRVVEGASTITQQVARNLLPDEIGTTRSLRRKVREALLARALERRWSKREILEVYLDLVFLGANAYGMAAGARAYFDRDVAELTLPEAATLAGLVQAPGRLDPRRNPAGARARRDEILARMARAGFIDEATRAAAAATPLTLHRPRPSYRRLAPWYAEHVRALLAAAIPRELDRGGLVVETAALPALAIEVEAAALAHAAAWAQDGPGRGATPQVAGLLWDHRTGYVEALVGGADPRDDRFDRMTHGCRQPGSAWKPVVYGAALEAGAITPGTALRDAPVTEYDEATNVFWKPRAGGRFRGLVLAQDAFASSLNAPAIEVLDRVGAPAVIALARRLGFTSPLAAVRPMALGASCVRPIELARAYAIIARGGAAVAPRFAVRVRRDDEALFDAAVPEDPGLDAAHRLDRLAALAGAGPDERVGATGGTLLDPRTAYQLTDMMAAVTTRGTAAAARALGRPSAGKTGTTNDDTDAWFVGFTGRLLGAVWIGFDDPSLKLGRRDGHEGDGAHAALPLWLRLVRLAEGSRPPAPVPGDPPPGLTRVAVDRETGQRAAPGAAGLAVWFRAGSEPTETAGQPGETATDFGRTARDF